MRDILFRGKRVDNGAWETGSFVGIRIWCSDARTYIADKMTGYNTPVIPETVGQYTGINDKNGRRIFDGDICEFTNTDGEKTLYTVMWDYHRWIVAQTYDGNDVDPDDLDEAFTEYAEVIGNIHDNPELSEVTDR